jgi:hypothetical protein
MKKILFGLFCLVAVQAAAQRSKCDHFDAHDLLVKSIVQKDEKVNVTYYDVAGNEVVNVCEANPRVLTFLEERNLRQLTSKYLPPDSTQSIRKIQFCFLLGPSGISNVRILKSDVRCQTVDELAAIVSKALLEAQLTCTLECWSYIETTFMEEVFYPIRVEKKKIYDDIEIKEEPKKRRKK